MSNSTYCQFAVFKSRLRQKHENVSARGKELTAKHWLTFRLCHQELYSEQGFRQKQIIQIISLNCLDVRNVIISYCLYTDCLHRHLVHAIVMTGCDLVASAKPWKMQLDMVKYIFEEFYQQVLIGHCVTLFLFNLQLWHLTARTKWQE